jgi:hypothetical protein
MSSWGYSNCQCLDPRISQIQNQGLTQSLFSYPLSRHTTTQHFDYTRENGLQFSHVETGLTTPPIVGDTVNYQMSPFGSHFFETRTYHH